MLFSEMQMAVHHLWLQYVVALTTLHSPYFPQPNVLLLTKVDKLTEMFWCPWYIPLIVSRTLLPCTCCVVMTRVHLLGLAQSTSIRTSLSAALVVWLVLFAVVLNVPESATEVMIASKIIVLRFSLKNLVLLSNDYKHAGIWRTLEKCILHFLSVLKKFQVLAMHN